MYYSLIEKLVGHADEFDEDWLDGVGIRFDVTLLSWGKSKLEAVKVVKMFSGMSLMEAKTATESAPTVFAKSLGFAKVHERFKQLRLQIEKPAATNMPPIRIEKESILDRLVSARGKMDGSLTKQKNTRQEV